MGITESLAKHVAQTRFEDIPAKVVGEAKNYIRNVVGCALGGAQTDVGKRQIELGKELDGKAESTLIGDGTKISRVFAAYTNAEVANVLDFDDGDYWTLSHPGCPIVASALAMAESIHATGKDFLTATIIGYDVALRLAHAMRSKITLPNGKEDRLQVLSYKALGVAALTGKLLGLDTAGMVNAFGVVGSAPVNRGQSPVHPAGAVLTHPYTETKYDEGIFALMGVFGTLRSRKVHGIQDILDTERFWKPGGATAWDPGVITKDLGKEFRLSELYIKPVPFCGQVTRVVSAVWEAMKGDTLNAGEIEEIKVIGVSKLPFYHWDTMVEGQFSTPCAVAMAVTGEEPGPRWYTSGRYKSPEIIAIGKKVKFIDDARAREIMLKEGRYTCTAEIKTTNGKVRSAHVEYEKGIPQNPFTEKELHHKFMVNSQDLIGEKKAQQLWDTFGEVEKIKDVTAIFK